MYPDLKANVHIKIDPSPILCKLYGIFPSPKEFAQCCPISVGVKLLGTLRATRNLPNYTAHLEAT